MSTFIAWLAEQTDRDDPVGDLARDTETDDCVWSGHSAEDLRDHLRAKHRLEQIVDDAIDEAEHEYRKAGILR